MNDAAEAPRDRRTVVLRAVVDDDDLQQPVGTIEHALDRFGDPGTGVEQGHHHAEIQLAHAAGPSDSINSVSAAGICWRSGPTSSS